MVGWLDNPPSLKTMASWSSLGASSSSIHHGSPCRNSTPKSKGFWYPPVVTCIHLTYAEYMLNMLAHEKIRHNLGHNLSRLILGLLSHVAMFVTLGCSSVANPTLGLFGKDPWPPWPPWPRTALAMGWIPNPLSCYITTCLVVDLPLWKMMEFVHGVGMTFSIFEMDNF